VRVVGLLLWVVCLFYLISAGVVWVSPTFKPNLSPPWHYLLSSGVTFLTGWYLLRRADTVVAFAYRVADDTTSSV
jgi:hypothetical protein